MLGVAALSRPRRSDSRVGVVEKLVECGGASGGGKDSDRDGFTGAGSCAVVLELEELAGGRSLPGLCWSSSRLRPRLGSLHRAASQMAVIWTRGEYVHELEREVEGDVGIFAAPAAGGDSGAFQHTPLLPPSLSPTERLLAWPEADDQEVLSLASTPPCSLVVGARADGRENDSGAVQHTPLLP